MTANSALSPSFCSVASSSSLYPVVESGEEIFPIWLQRLSKPGPSPSDLRGEKETVTLSSAHHGQLPLHHCRVAELCCGVGDVAGNEAKACDQGGAGGICGPHWRPKHCTGG